MPLFPGAPGRYRSRTFGHRPCRAAALHRTPDAEQAAGLRHVCSVRCPKSSSSSPPWSVAVWIGMLGSRAPMPRRLLIGWIGIRGIGRLNYLAYALTHGLDKPQAMLAAQIAVTIVVLSILVHGMTAPPLMA
jgi:hypothetical protein